MEPEETQFSRLHELLNEGVDISPSTFHWNSISIRSIENFKFVSAINVYLLGR